jgi:hypothetical protein
MPDGNNEYSLSRVLDGRVLRTEHGKPLYNRSPRTRIVIRERDWFKIGPGEALDHGATQSASTEDDYPSTASGKLVECALLANASRGRHLAE